jgi:hypothetical protein
MITPRTLAVFHFGFALVFLLVGGFIIYIVHFSEPRITPSVPPREAAMSARQSLAQEQNLENLRSSALTYHDHWNVLTQALLACTDLGLQLVLYSFGTTTLLLTIGGVMSLRLRSS